jgi:hypothetical protein
MADPLPYKFTWFELLDSQNYRLNGVSLDDATYDDGVGLTGVQPEIAIAGCNVYDEISAVIVPHIRPTSQAESNAFDWFNATQMALTNPQSKTDNMLWLPNGYNETGAGLDLGGATTNGMTWTCPAGGEGMHTINATLMSSPGAGLTVGQNFSLSVEHLNQPIAHCTGLATGSGGPWWDRCCVSTAAYIKPGETIRVELGAGYTLTEYTLINCILTVNRISGPVAGVTGS